MAGEVHDGDDRPVPVVDKPGDVDIAVDRTLFFAPVAVNRSRSFADLEPERPITFTVEDRTDGAVDNGLQRTGRIVIVRAALEGRTATRARCRVSVDAVQQYTPDGHSRPVSNLVAHTVGLTG